MYALALLCSSLVGLIILTWWGDGVTLSMEPLQSWCTSTQQAEHHGIAGGRKEAYVRIIEQLLIHRYSSHKARQVHRDAGV